MSDKNLSDNKATAGGSGRVTRAELEGRIRGLQNDLQRRMIGRAQSYVAVGVAVGAVALAAAYVIGRRSGTKAKNTAG